MKLCIYVFLNVSLNIPNYFIKKKCLNSTIKGIKASLKRQIGFTTIIFFAIKMSVVMSWTFDLTQNLDVNK